MVGAVIPVIQTRLDAPPRVNGNCLRACLATLLEIGIDEMPAFEDAPTDAHRWQDLTGWLLERGFVLFEIRCPFPGLHMVGGPSPRGAAHMVVFDGDRMTHDPHPEGGGLVSIDDRFVLVPVDPTGPWEWFAMGDQDKGFANA